MLAFSCPLCAHLVTFEASRCLYCSSDLVFDPVQREIRVLDAAAPRGLCANAALIGCNWAADVPGSLCRSCALTRTRPADGDRSGIVLLADAEAAKRRLLFELDDLGLPLGRGLAGAPTFEMLSSREKPVSTGHADGVITLDLAEADPAEREPRRVELEEPYRTVLGHLRHEIGHYYQPILVPAGSDAEPEMRRLFGDERIDYGAARDRYYDNGPPDDWHESFVSAYATMHPWEDWAESFAHYLHIRDTLQTAIAYGVSVAGPMLPVADEAPLHSSPLDPVDDVDSALETWIPLTFALNQLSRSMGQPDIYPFVLPPAALEKLRFIGSLIADASSTPRAVADPNTLTARS